MISQGENVEAHALRKQGWSISAIARHLGRDRKTVRAYLSEQREPGVRARTVPDSFTAFAPYVAQRLAEDPHVWAVVLFDEVVAAGFTGSYPTFTRQLRQRGLRPACGACTPTKGRPAAIIEHPPGAETQWDWVDLPSPPAAWGWGKTARLLLGTLPRSGRWRACLSQATVQPHPVEGLDRVTRALAGVSRDWRLDRMATVVHPASGDVTASFAAVARRYAVTVAICPPRRGNRKGAVQKAIHGAAQRWWRTLPEDLTVERHRHRSTHSASPSSTCASGSSTGHASRTPSMPVTSRCAQRPWCRSRPPSARPGWCRRRRWWPGAATATRWHRPAPAWSCAPTAAARPHRAKTRIPISADTAALLPATPANAAAHRDVVIDMAAYTAAANGRNTLQ
jgi:transposase